MTSTVLEIFTKEIELIKNDSNTLSIIIVGSSKDLFYNKDLQKVNDIDLFIFTKEQEENQIRINKIVSEIEFDLNYISKNGCNNFIDSKEYFFLKIYEGNIIYDTSDYGKNILKRCQEAYEEGPEALDDDVKRDKFLEIYSQIKRLDSKDEYDEFEYDFFVNLALRDILKMYYIKNNKWVPKDKKLIKSIKKDDINIYNIIKSTYDNKYEMLVEIFNYLSEF